MVLAITLFSLSSARASVVDEAQRRRALLLLVSTALVRALSELLAINTLGALALTVDVYALGIGLGLNARRRAVSPLGLALLFSLSLPIERLLQRMVGYPLQLISAQAACSILGLWRGDLRCEGTQLSAGGAALSVDLPCSGAQGLVLLLVLVFALQALRWIRGPRLVPALAAAGLGAVLGNALRLVLIASAVGRGWPAEAEPLHSLLGLISLAVAAAPVLALVKAPPPPPPSARPAPSGGASLRSSAWSGAQWGARPRRCLSCPCRRGRSTSPRPPPRWPPPWRESARIGALAAAVAQGDAVLCAFWRRRLQDLLSGPRLDPRAGLGPHPLSPAAPPVGPMSV